MWLTRLCRYLLLPLLLAARKVPSTFTLPCCPHESLNKKSNLEVNTHTYRATSTERIESVQDFLIKLDMKPCMHLVEISIFSLNLVIVRLTKIMNRADKNWAQF